MLLLLGTYFARDASYAHEYTDVRMVTENINKHDDSSITTYSALSTLPNTNDDNSDSSDDDCTGLRLVKMEPDNSAVSEDLSIVVDNNSMGALFYSSVKCTSAAKYPHKDILLHRCTSPMNKTTQGKINTADTDHATDKNDKRDVRRQLRRQLRVMVAARVFVGRYTVGHRTYRKPPPLNPTPALGHHCASFDSCVNYADDPTLFVIFDSSQCYPQHFITYSCQSQ